MNQGRPANRLAAQRSPYLLQHAHNPVDWWPWGEAAFAEARRRGVPIFLSIGYATCYWCHVMERESFEDDRVAAVLNQHFVPVKVDREERADVDDIYMTAVQALTGAGGWPMSVFLTPPGARAPDDPGLEPFYAGTYFPRESRYGRPGFIDLMRSIADAWGNQRTQVLEQAGRITAAVRAHLGARTPPVRLTESTVGRAVATLLRLHDGRDGGFGRAPKFPQPVYLWLLLEARASVADEDARRGVDLTLRHTLDRMALGGIFDQVGGGFHRYSTDERWLVPHFEKMLYDNAMLLSAYSRAWGAWGDPLHRRAALRTIAFVRRELADPGDGAFYSALDAEVNHREGQNYLWTRAQLTEVLGEADAAFAAKVYGVTDAGNFRDPHHPEDPPSNVPALADRPASLARELGMGEAALLDRLDSINARLLEARARRDQPLRDDKVITSWNGLMMLGFADAAIAFADPALVDDGARAARWIVRHHDDGTGGIVRTSRGGERGAPGLAEDYAALCRGLCALVRAGRKVAAPCDDLLPHAARLARTAVERFGLRAHEGGTSVLVLHDAPEGRSDLLVRPRSVYDGAMPCASSVMAHALLDLAELTSERAWFDEAVALLASMSGAMHESPVALAHGVEAVLRVLRAEGRAFEGLPRAADEEQEGGAQQIEGRDSPVQVFASGERITVPRRGEADLDLMLRIDEGYHINAIDPGVEGLIGLDVRVHNGTGVECRVIEPEARRMEAHVEGEPGPRVHVGDVLIRVKLRRSGEPWAGNPLVLVTYQPCRDDACLAPVTVELDVALDEG